jgi:hypothetical protein
MNAPAWPGRRGPARTRDCAPRRRAATPELDVDPALAPTLACDPQPDPGRRGAGARRALDAWSTGRSDDAVAAAAAPRAQAVSARLPPEYAAI